MYRVVIKRFADRHTRIIEKGPWHVAREDAENWAEILADCGYHTEVESQHGWNSPGDDDNDQLRNALSSMA